ncbi:hypothetical protein EDEG_01849 [Edhazardia aedis USNM 41457]|uniref:Uncharacterized protein n=1 Tax=Edhazardia aedis (strain USNM 41457) TaxID=1003232 RepID=J9DMN9_EDHAE|nr:hypothetical protein EDEG_01849 [Edhazardia aedis USNM 41457]|eukprot:EJW03850.1 hypothetical protein EDEG_01849 [Edhazardia aedis USNM 41457]
MVFLLIIGLKMSKRSVKFIFLLYLAYKEYYLCYFWPLILLKKIMIHFFIVIIICSEKSQNMQNNYIRSTKVTNSKKEFFCNENICDEVKFVDSLSQKLIKDETCQMSCIASDCSKQLYLDNNLTCTNVPMFKENVVNSYDDFSKHFPVQNHGVNYDNQNFTTNKKHVNILDCNNIDTYEKNKLPFSCLYESKSALEVARFDEYTDTQKFNHEPFFLSSQILNANYPNPNANCERIYSSKENNQELHVCDTSKTIEIFNFTPNFSSQKKPRNSEKYAEKTLDIFFSNSTISSKQETRIHKNEIMDRCTKNFASDLQKKTRSIPRDITDIPRVENCVMAKNVQLYLFPNEYYKNCSINSETIPNIGVIPPDNYKNSDLHGCATIKPITFCDVSFSNQAAYLPIANNFSNLAQESHHFQRPYCKINTTCDYLSTYIPNFDVSTIQYSPENSAYQPQPQYFTEIKKIIPNVNATMQKACFKSTDLAENHIILQPDCIKNDFTEIPDLLEKIPTYEDLLLLNIDFNPSKSEEIPTLITNTLKTTENFVKKKNTSNYYDMVESKRLRTGDFAIQQERKPEKKSSMEIFFDKLSIFQKIIVVKSYKDIFSNSLIKYKFFYISTVPQKILEKKRQTQRSNVFLKKQNTQSHNKDHKFENQKKIRGKFWFVCYDNFQAEWFYPNEKCEKYVFREISSDSKFNNKPLNELRNKSYKKLKDFFLNGGFYNMNYLSYNTKIANTFFPSTIIMPECESNPDKGVYLAKKPTMESFPGNNNYLDVSFVQNGLILTNNIEIDSVLNAGNVVFFIFSRLKTPENYLYPNLDEHCVDPDFLVNYYQNPCYHHLIKCSIILYPKRIETFVSYVSNKFNSYHRTFSDFKSCIHKKYLIEKAHVKHWKCFLIKYCTKNSVFLFLMNGIDKFLQEKYLDDDETIYSKFLYLENEKSLKNESYFCKCLLICYFLQNQTKNMDALSFDIEKQRFNLYKNQSIFLKIFFDAFGIFFRPHVANKLNTWIKAEIVKLRYEENVQKVEEKVAFPYVVKGLKDTATELKGIFYNLNIVSLRVCIIPEDFDISLLFVDLILMVANKFYRNVKSKLKFHRSTEKINIVVFLEFIRKKWIKSILNYCIRERFLTTIDKIACYIAKFDNIQEMNFPLNGSDMNISDFLLKIFSNANLIDEFSALCDILISIECERFKC